LSPTLWFTHHHAPHCGAAYMANSNRSGKTFFNRPFAGVLVEGLDTMLSALSKVSSRAMSLHAFAKPVVARDDPPRATPVRRESVDQVTGEY